MKDLIIGERNFRIHLMAACLAITGGVYFHINSLQWALITLCIGGVLAFEAINTAIEILCNHVTTEVHPQIRRIKDISASAVLLVSMAALLTGIMIFLPHIRALLA